MADGRGAPGGSRRGEKHGWLTADRYIAIHRVALERHSFALEDLTVLQQVSRPSGPRLTVEGHILCRGRVVVEVTKDLSIRVNARNQTEVRGLRYRYHVRVGGRGNLLRYDNSHGFDEFHRHEYVFPTAGQKPLETLTREEFPTLIEVLDEVQAMAERLGLAG